MSKATKATSRKTSAKATATRPGPVNWPAQTRAAGRILREPTGKVSKTSMATITHTSKTLNRALKRLADK